MIPYTNIVALYKCSLGAICQSVRLTFLCRITECIVLLNYFWYAFCIVMSIEYEKCIGPYAQNNKPGLPFDRLGLSGG